MARNLAGTDCDRCGFTPKLIEEPRLITKAEAGVYFDEYEGMVVANADCPECGAKYLAWVDDSQASWRSDPKYTSMMFQLEPSKPQDGLSFIDLSFRSSFNDEPGDGDLPDWETPVIIRLKPDVACKVRELLRETNCADLNEAALVIDKAIEEYDAD